MKKAGRVYVAGAYSANNVIGVLDNMRRGMKAGWRVLKRYGLAPFVPWFDYHFSLMSEEGESVQLEDYYRYSMAWLEVSEAVLVLPNSEHSKGTQAEIQRALELNIPVFFTEKALQEYFAEVK